MIYSHSRLSTFENCKLAFKFRYIDNIKTDIDGIEAFMGNRVHEALEYLYNKVKIGHVPELKEILQHYSDGWNKHFHDQVRVVKKEYTTEDYKKLGEKCIIQYYSDRHPFKENVLANEKAIIVDIDGVKLRGFIDRIDKKGNIIEIHDYKTGLTLPPQKKIDKDRQLGLYQIAAQELYPDAEGFKLIWHYLAFNQDLESTRTPEDLEVLKQEIKAIVKEVEQEREYLPKVSRLCDWCEYRSICPAWGNEIPEKNWAKEEGEKLVKEYYELRKELTEGKKLLDSLKKDILEYSEQMNTLTLSNEKNQIKITETSNLVMPKNAKIENELIELLKENNLYDKVSKINMSALSQILEESPLELQKKIRPLLHEEKTRKIIIKKK